MIQKTGEASNNDIFIKTKNSLSISLFDIGNGLHVITDYGLWITENYWFFGLWITVY